MLMITPSNIWSMLGDVFTGGPPGSREVGAGSAAFRRRPGHVQVHELGALTVDAAFDGRLDGHGDVGGAEQREVVDLVLGDVEPGEFVVVGEEPASSSGWAMTWVFERMSIVVIQPRSSLGSPIRAFSQSINAVTLTTFVEEVRRVEVAVDEDER